MLAFDLPTQRREAVVQAIALEEREHVAQARMSALAVLLHRRDHAVTRRVDRRAWNGPEARRLLEWLIEAGGPLPARGAVPGACRDFKQCPGAGRRALTAHKSFL